MLGIIIQARMGSTRLPGKILSKIGDKSLLEHIFYRLTFLQHDAKIVLATSKLEQDDLVAEFCQQNSIECFRGSEQNVLQRYYDCAKKYGFTNIVRMTADNPFVDIEELDKLIDLHVASKADYSQSFTYLPIGVGSEVFTFFALEKSYLYGKEPHHIEHVNEYITDNPQLFRMAVLQVGKDKIAPEVRLTVDTKEDYAQANFIVANNSTDYCDTKNAISLYYAYKNLKEKKE